MHYWFNDWHMIWMTISWLAAIGLLLTFIWLWARALGEHYHGNGSPEEILRRRYAAGEIDRENYERALEELRETKKAA